MIAVHRSGLWRLVGLLILLSSTLVAPSPALACLEATAGQQRRGFCTPTPVSWLRHTIHTPLVPIADQAQLNGIRHDYQRWNNCGPTTIRMTLSYFGFDIPQATIAQVLKPDPQDVNVSPDEMVAYLEGKGLRATVRVNGNIETLMHLLSNDIPVIVEQWIEEKGGMGHYRLVSAYDRPREFLVFQDSYFGPNYRRSFADFDRAWKVFNRLYIPVYTPEQEPLVKAILGPEFDDTLMLRHALEMSLARTQADPEDPHAWYALGDAYLAHGEARAAVEAYEKAIAIGLPWRFFWYQFGPLKALLQIGDYQRVLALTGPVLEKMPNIEELHFYRGEAFRGLGDRERARQEYDLAIKYHPSYIQAEAASREMKP